MRPGTWLLLVGLMVLCGLMCAEAQQVTPAGPAPWRVYFGGSALVSSQPAGGHPAGSVWADPVPSISGTGFGLSALVGAGRRVSVEAEITRGASLSSTYQAASYGVSRYSASYRDTLVSGFVRWRANPAGRIHIEPVGGITLAFGHGTLTTDFQRRPSEPSSRYTHPLSKTSLGLGAGVDVLVPVNAVVSMTGSARLQGCIWNDVPRSYPVVGPALPDWVLQFGGGVQVSWARSPSPGPYVPGPTGGGDAAKGASPQRGYVGGAILVSHQPEGYADGHYLSAPLGGTGAGFSGVVGGFITRNLSLEAEISIGPALTAEQWFIQSVRYSTSYRDVLLSGFLRWRALRFTHVAIEPVGGLTIAAGHAARTAQDYSLYPNEPFDQPYDASVTRITFGVGGGADLVVPAGPSLAVIGSFRLHVLDRDDERDGPPELGIGPWVYQFGGGVRWAF